MNGFFLIDKEENWTSRDVCNKISHLFQEKKVGHIGTLDPFATGLLIVSVGKGNKANQFILEEKKEYLATIKLGQKTDTGDITGKIIEEKEIPLLSKEDIRRVLSSFIGKGSQIPPMYSAIHYQGEKLYSLARKGITVNRDKRPIEIFDLTLISYLNNEITITTTVSKGTYIRVLAEDIASALNTVGHLKSLSRLKIGNISLKNAHKINDLSPSHLIPTYLLLKESLPTLELNEEEIKKVKNGLSMKFDVKGDRILLINQNQEVIAVYQRKIDNIFISLRGLF